jgi:hypothetical protein
VLMTHAAPSDVSPIADTWRPSDRQEVHAVVNPAVGDGGSGR